MADVVLSEPRTEMVRGEAKNPISYVAWQLAATSSVGASSNATFFPPHADFTSSE
jgi:hypothetical protein